MLLVSAVNRMVFSQASVRAEGPLIFVCTGHGGLVFLSHQLISNHQYVHVRKHEATVGIRWVMDDGLSTHVETGIDKHWASRQSVKGTEDCMKAWGTCGINSLHAGGIINMGDGWNIAAQRLQLCKSNRRVVVGSGRRLLVGSAAAEVRRGDWCYQQHVWALHFKIKPLALPIGKYRWCERSE
jgi:hypothetical protein